MAETPAPPSPASPASPAGAPPRQARSRARRGALAAVAIAAAALATVAGLATAVWTTEAGTSWCLRHLPGLEVTGPRGTLGGAFAAQRVVYRGFAGQGQVDVHGLSWPSASLSLSARSPWLHLHLATLQADRVDLTLPPADAAKTESSAPRTLRSPVELAIDHLKVTEWHAAAWGAEPLQHLDAQLQLGADEGATHRLVLYGVQRAGLHAVGRLQVGTDAPLALEGVVGVAQEARAAMPAWALGGHVRGPLHEPQLWTTLRVQPSAAAPAQTLDAQATLRPFAPWPLGALKAQARALDLSLFDAAAPRTALDLDAQASPAADHATTVVAVRMRNQNPGRWDQGQLPLRTLEGQLSTPTALAQGAHLPDINLSSLQAELGDANGSAGRLDGHGTLNRQGWNLALQITTLAPAQLDNRAPALRVSGQLNLTGQHDLSQGVDVLSDLTGVQVVPGAPPVEWHLDAHASTQKVTLRQALVRAGSARAELRGVLEHPAPTARWQLDGQTEWLNFDPSVWWPGAPGSAWRRGPHRLNFSGQASLSAPGDALRRSAAAWWPEVTGRAHATLGASLLAGVPLSGEGRLDARSGRPATWNVAAKAGSNSLDLHGQWAAQAADTGLTMNLQGPALGELSPLLALLPVGPAASGHDLSGTLNAQVHLQGRWPAVKTDGHLEAHALRFAAVSLRDAQAQWTLGSRADDPMTAEVRLTQAQFERPGMAPAILDDAHLQVQGTGRAHRLQVQAHSRARPPTWLSQLSGHATSSTAAHPSSVLEVVAQGGWLSGGAPGEAGWHGTLDQLDWAPTAPADSPWAAARHITIDWHRSAVDTRVTLSPGRLDAFGAGLRWTRAEWRAPQGPTAPPAAFDFDAELETLQVAPWLQRLQPDFGWGGNLQLNGHVRVHGGADFRADIVVERQSGDLRVTDDLGTRALGLTDLRLGLEAHDGTWSFTQGVAGHTLGVASGAVVVRTDPVARWPAAEAPIEGVLELQVADLGTWGHWVPPGWRVGGTVHSSASIGGHFGAPTLKGALEGDQLTLRSGLQGVNVSDGRLRVRLDGELARIEEFSAHGGTGRVEVGGTATLGAAPQMDLTLQADRFGLLDRVDRRLVLSGKTQLHLTRDTVALHGDLAVDEGLFDITRADAPSLGEDVIVRRAKADAATAPAGTPEGTAEANAAPTPRQVDLDLGLDLGEHLHLQGRGLDTDLRGRLQLSAPQGKLAVKGAVHTHAGTYAAYAQKLTVDRGLIEFNGALDNPRLDIEATRPNLDVRVGVNITGHATEPRVRLFSEPDMADIDKLSWLVMGRASYGLGRTDTGLLQSAAIALLAGENGRSPDTLFKSLGISDISLHSSDTNASVTVLSVGKQISQRWYLGYERGLNATTGTFQLIYRIAQRFTLRAQSGADDSLDVIWTLRWQ